MFIIKSNRIKLKFTIILQGQYKELKMKEKKLDFLRVDDSNTT